MELTQPVDWLNKEFEGYVVNTAFSSENNDKVMSLAGDISAKFPDVFYPTPSDGLHVTLLDWIAPLISYEGANKVELFDSIHEKYDSALEKILQKYEPINVNFNKIIVTPTTIIITGEDNGSIQKIRQEFVESIELLPGTKMPPQIIHCSLGRFIKEVPVTEIQNFINQKSINFIEIIQEFRLVNTHREPMLEFDVLKTYNLGLLQD